ncbi:MAG: HAD-IIIA family hydrolase [Pirellulales bacterium]
MSSASQSRIKALLLAAGLGTRLRPLTHRLPKCLVPIHGHPLLDYWIASIRETQIRDVLINTHHFPDQVRSYLQSVNEYGRPHVRESYEPKLLGSAGTIAANRRWLDDADDCLIIYTDNLSTVDLRELIRFHKSHDDPFTMMLFRTQYPQKCGIAKLDADQRVIEFVEKPQTPSSNLANAGVYVLSADAYREVADRQAFDLGHDVLPTFVGRMRGWLFDGYHRDIGSLESLELAMQEVPTVMHRWSKLTRGSAVFLDRDGTIIEHVHHLTDPTKVRLLPGAADAIRRLQQNGYKCVVVTNQSVVGRGMLSMAGLHRIHDEMARQLAQSGIKLDGIYLCTLAPKESDPTIVEHPDRKPGPGMIFQAAEELSLNLSESWMVGDSISDVLAGHNAGCRGSIKLISSADCDMDRAGLIDKRTYAAFDIMGAVDLILHVDEADVLSNDLQSS